jgi:hypothetical protein
MMSPMNSSSVFGGMVGLVVIVAVLALVAGGALSGSDLLNPTTSDAIAHEKKLAADSKAAKDAADLEAYQAQKAAEIEKANSDLANYQAIQAAKAQAELDRIRSEAEAYQRKLEQDLMLARLTTHALLAGGTLTSLVLGIGATIFLRQLGRSRLILARVQAAQSDPWRNTTFRAEAKRQARATELAMLGSAVVWQAAHKFSPNGDGKRWPKYEPAETMQR